eukprot:356618-Chlamydomonas_euryale.AAC.2
MEKSAVMESGGGVTREILVLPTASKPWQSQDGGAQSCKASAADYPAGLEPRTWTVFFGSHASWMKTRDSDLDAVPVRLRLLPPVWLAYRSANYNLPCRL